MSFVPLRRPEEQEQRTLHRFRFEYNGNIYVVVTRMSPNQDVIDEGRVRAIRDPNSIVTVRRRDENGEWILARLSSQEQHELADRYSAYMRTMGPQNQFQIPASPAVGSVIPRRPGRRSIPMADERIYVSALDRNVRQARDEAQRIAREGAGRDDANINRTLREATRGHELPEVRGRVAPRVVPRSRRPEESDLAIGLEEANEPASYGQTYDDTLRLARRGEPQRRRRGQERETPAEPTETVTYGPAEVGVTRPDGLQRRIVRERTEVGARRIDRNTIDIRLPGRRAGTGEAFLYTYRLTNSNMAGMNIRDILFSSNTRIVRIDPDGNQAVVPNDYTTTSQLWIWYQERYGRLQEDRGRDEQRRAEARRATPPREMMPPMQSIAFIDSTGTRYYVEIPENSYRAYISTGVGERHAWLADYMRGGWRTHTSMEPLYYRQDENGERVQIDAEAVTLRQPRRRNRE